MAWKRYASAITSEKDIEFDKWMDAIRAQHEGAVPKDYVGRIAKTVLRKCDPRQYLLSHSTIVASVDTHAPRGVKTGTSMSRGVQIDVRFPDYRINKECGSIVNNNGDAWSRPLLLSSYKTFIGAHNYVEHVQIPELSKGFIVDAIARDLGDTCYVDILVATDRKHKILVQDILSGKIDSMSMGCLSQFTVCTKCGNVAADDSQLCICIAAEGKGNKFLDEDGFEHSIAELVGHVSVPNSNQFIEASWVRNPAFKGAVRRNILNADNSLIAARLENAAAVYDIRRELPEVDGLKRAASSRIAEQQQSKPDQGGDAFESSSTDQWSGSDDSSSSSDSSQGDDSSQKAAPESAPSGDKFQDLIDKIQGQVLESIVQGLTKKLAPEPADVGTVGQAPPDMMSLNDNVVRSSDAFARAVRNQFNAYPKLVQWAVAVHKIATRGPTFIKASGLTSRDLVILSWIIDRVRSKEASADLYKVAMTVGASNSFPSERSYLATCSIKLGRTPTAAEKSFFLRTGKFASAAR